MGTRTNESWTNRSRLGQGNNCPRPICPIESFRISTLNDVSKSNTEGEKQSLSKCGIKSGKMFSFSIPTR